MIIHYPVNTLSLPRRLELDGPPLKLRFLVGVSFSGFIWASGGVGNLADELFENVFEGNQAAGLAVLVDQASEV